jgi:menaquinone-dependent protoporphyrinogen oxidase
MSQILIVFSSRHGHTRKIAERIAAAVRSTGTGTVVTDVEHAGRHDLHDYDAVIAGGSVHMERHDAHLVDWVARHATTLKGMPSGFFSVSLTATADRDKAAEFADRFEEETGWTAGRRTILAGALQYREYSFFTRQMVRQIAHAKGLPTDTSHDHEFTERDAVDVFAAAVARDAAAAVQPA